MSRNKSLAACMSLLAAFVIGCRPDPVSPPDLAPGVVLKPADEDALIAKIKAAPAKSMSQCGIVGAQGGMRVKCLKSGTHELIFPLPQLADGQAPLWFSVRSTPPEAVIEYRLRPRSDGNVVVGIKLKSERNQEVYIEWHSIVLMSANSIVPNNSAKNDFSASTACVQSDSQRITKLAAELWPKSGKAADFAANIQNHLRSMKQAKPPKSLDAIGILDSGANGICTANANLAAALLRAKSIPARTMAVIPPTAQRLEMHRIVEYFDDGAWRVFDPSSLHTDIPMKSWQYVIMAKTTKADEDLAMKLRMGAMPGCPYAQEIELVTDGITTWGQDFFWTSAKPLAEFDVTEEAGKLAAAAWQQYLEKGELSPISIKAANATNSKELLEALQAK